MDEYSKLRKPCASDNASFLSRVFFFWTYPLFGEGYKKELEYEDLYQCCKKDESNKVGDQLMKEWEKELKKKKPNLALAILRAFGPSFLFTTIVIGGFEEFVIRIAQPFLLGGILDYFSGELQNQTVGHLCIFGFLLCTLSFTTCHHLFFINNARHGMRARVAVQKLIMEKLLVVSKSSLYDKKIGQIINLISNDVNKFDECSFFLPYLLLAPIQAVIISALLWPMLGLAYVVGAGVIILLVPIQATMGRAFGKVRRGIAKFTDQRIRLMSEIISGMKVIKMYSWERSFADMIADIRSKEVKKIRMACFLKGTNLALSFVTARIILFAILISYVSLGNQLTAKTVFVTMALCNTLKLTLTFFFPTAIYCVAESLVSCDRIRQFLLLDEAKDAQLGNVVSNGVFQPIEEKSVEVSNLKVFWDLKASEPCLDGVTFSVKSGELLTVVGPVGSGKTSLLLSLLREIHIKSGKMHVNGKISYAAQDSWTFNASIRENIVFGKNFDKDRYMKVLAATSLNQDLKILPYGDMTLVGERGVGLSGGQRARVSLARALYHQADIYLLDDPLSAVDAQVANHIFEKCCKEYLASKIVILITHHLHFLRKSDKILLLNQGKAKQFDSFDALRNSSSDMMTIISVDKQQQNETTRSNENVHRTYSILSTHSSTSESGEIERPCETQNGPEIAKEERAIGRVKAKVYWIYFKAGAGVSLALIALIFNIASQVLFSANDIWLARWSNRASAISMAQYNHSVVPSLDRSIETVKVSLNESGEFSADTQVSQDYQHNIIIYSGLVLGLFVTTLLRTTIFFYMCNRASVNLHNTIFYRILRSPMCLFESNPVGRILNRFSRDLNIIDELLPATALDQLMNGLTALGVLIVVGIVAWYMVFPAIVLIILVIFYRNIYIKTGRDVKRLEATARSPVYSHIANTVDGLTTIRAFNVEHIFRKKFASYLNDHSGCWYLYLCTSRTLGVWTDWTCLIYIAGTTMVVVFFSNVIPPGSAGLALTQILLLTGMFQWLVRQSAEFESQMTSVERIVEYTQLKTEAELISAVRPPREWPVKGTIKFDNVSLTYPSSPSPSLRDINLNIQSGEKIGVVGRTGAGKSSLVSCLFRLVEPKGSITIDGVDITTIGLQDLRKKISIIPQDPVIFAGTIRSNLDPFREHQDSELWEVLQDVQLKEKVKEINGDLEHEIREGGDNFSVGQRQLICLARALLRNNKVLIIDEGTANVDLKTDQLIQRTIRTKFSNCTVITIAHRLNTIIDSDRVLVMDSGQAVEFDAPHVLLQRNDSYFTKLVRKTGKNMSQKLFSLAEEHYKNGRNKV